VKWLIKRGLRLGWYRGVLDGSRPWIVVAGASVLARLATRALKREDEVIWSGQVEPGQVVTVENESGDGEHRHVVTIQDESPS
jgi:hypothetical protein